jgi:hypothetical protein
LAASQSGAAKWRMPGNRAGAPYDNLWGGVSACFTRSILRAGSPAGGCLAGTGPAGIPGTYIRIDPFGTAEAPSGLMAAFYWGPHVAVSLEKPVAASAPRSAIGESAAPAMNDQYLGLAAPYGKEWSPNAALAYRKDH